MGELRNRGEGDRDGEFVPVAVEALLEAPTAPETADRQYDESIERPRRAEPAGAEGEALIRPEIVCLCPGCLWRRHVQLQVWEERLRREQAQVEASAAELQSWEAGLERREVRAAAHGRRRSQALRRERRWCVRAWAFLGGLGVAFSGFLLLSQVAPLLSLR